MTDIFARSKEYIYRNYSSFKLVKLLGFSESEYSDELCNFMEVLETKIRDYKKMSGIEEMDLMEFIVDVKNSKRLDGFMIKSIIHTIYRKVNIDTIKKVIKEDYKRISVHFDGAVILEEVFNELGIEHASMEDVELLIKFYDKYYENLWRQA